MQSDDSGKAVSRELQHKPGQRFQDIIDRIEFLRTHLTLSKSAFARRIGVTPQTYNNFTGSQRSKPSVELLYGIVAQFGANPSWVLTGALPMFMDGFDPRTGGPLPNTVPLPNWAPAEFPSEHTSAVLAEIKPVIERVEAAIYKISGENPSLDRLNDVLKRYARINPQGFEEDVSEFIAMVEQRISVN